LVDGVAFTDGDTMIADPTGRAGADNAECLPWATYEHQCFSSV
jgi:hypothetical protein